MTSERTRLRDRIIDVAETFFGEWISTAQVATLLQARKTSIVRTIHRGMPDHIAIRTHQITGETELRARTRSYLATDQTPHSNNG